MTGSNQTSSYTKSTYHSPTRKRYYRPSYVPSDSALIVGTVVAAALYLVSLFISCLITWKTMGFYSIGFLDIQSMLVMTVLLILGLIGVVEGLKLYRAIFIYEAIYSLGSVIVGFVTGEYLHFKGGIQFLLVFIAVVRIILIIVGVVAAENSPKASKVCLTLVAGFAIAILILLNVLLFSLTGSEATFPAVLVILLSIGYWISLIVAAFKGL